MFKLYAGADMCDQVRVLKDIESTARQQQQQQLRTRTPYTKRALMLDNKELCKSVHREVQAKTIVGFKETMQPSRYNFQLGGLVGPMKGNGKACARVWVNNVRAEPPYRQMYSDGSTELPSATTMSGVSPETYGRTFGNCDGPTLYAPTQQPTQYP